MKRWRIILLAFLLTLSGIASRAQTPPKNVPQLIATIDTFRSHTHAEKVHIQFDKPYYTLGDTIWMKVYVVNAENNWLSGLSKVLYVDIIGPRDSIISTLNTPVVNGLGMADFTLSRNLKEGNYRIRAYTNWMRNFSDDLFFDHIIPVGDAASRVLTKTNYVFTKTGNDQNVSAEIAYLGIDHAPLAGKDVDYEILLDSKSILKGKGLTDTNGYLKISFPGKQTGDVRSGMINTGIKLDKQTVISSIPVKFADDIADLQFFPESGQMVEGMRSKIAFKALGNNGMGKDVSGYIIDKNDKQVSEFKSIHAGMGYFFLVPEPGNSYTAVVRLSDGEKVVKLPKAESKGYVLSVTKTDSAKVLIEVAASKDLVNAGDVTLIAQQNGIIKYSAVIPIKKELMRLALNKAELATGIVQLTLFSSANEPLAERLVFIQRNDPLKMNTSTDKPVYAAREKVMISLEAQNHDNKPASGSFSVAVTDMGKIPSDEADETTIFSNLLLSSDLKGYIERPNYYFTNSTLQKETDLDNLMLTQGWRRFTWKEILYGKLPSFAFKADQGLPISGTLTAYTNKPLAKGKITLLSAAGELIETKSDENGHFKFKDLDINNGTSYKVFAEDQRGITDINVHFDKVIQVVKPKPFYTDNGTIINFQKYIESARAGADETINPDASKGINLQAVTVRASLNAQWNAKRDSIRKIALENSANLNGKGKADQVLIFADLQPGCPVLSRCLDGVLTGVTIARIPDGKSGEINVALSRNGKIGAASISGAMPIYMDGREVGKDLDVIVPSIVSSIEVLKGATAAVYGIGASNGVLIITTKRGGPNYNALIDEYKTITPHTVPTKIDSPPQYYFGRQFYSPDYTAHSDLRIPDQRTTVYWNPDLITDEKGKATLSFFNPDTPGTYRAVIEGLDDSGNLGRKVFTYTVK